MKRRPISKLLLPRVMILAVLVINLQCALAFIVNPLAYAASFELVGEPGRAAVIGIGILFLMWQVPYVFALLHPRKNFRSLTEAVLMQAIGLVGEWFLLRSVPAANAMLRGAILRFVLFDAAGLLLLLLAGLFTHHFIKSDFGETHAD